MDLELKGTVKRSEMDSPQQAVRAQAELPLCNRSFGTTGFRRTRRSGLAGRLASMQAECQLSAEAGLSVAPAQQVHQHPSGAVAERRGVVLSSATAKKVDFGNGWLIG